MTTQPPTKPSPIPRKLDDAMIVALSDLVSKGNYYHDACAIAGISEPTYYEWIKLARQDETNGLTEESSIYLRLAKSLQKARADNRAQFVAVIKEAAFVKREWLPAITYLERTDPDNWGRKDRVRVDSHETKEITVTHVEIVLNEAGRAPQVIEGEVKELPEGAKQELLPEERNDS